MASDKEVIDHLNFADLTQTALRSVIRQALLKAALPQGLPGEHHFFITFPTRAKGVVIPDDVLENYPQEITIVLQHQYRDLKVFEESFHVTLSFGGLPKVLKVPFSAVTRFYDPSVQFMLDFEAEEKADDLINLAADNIHDKNEPNIIAPFIDENVDDSPKVISLEQFRKK